MTLEVGPLIVFDIVLHGRIQKTLRPVNQGRLELYWFVIDRLPDLKLKYGPDLRIFRRTVQE